MKFASYQTVLDETVVELDVKYQDVIERLRAQQGYCRNVDGQDRRLEFVCTDKGHFWVDNLRTNRSENERAYRVVGEVLNDNGNGKVVIYTVHDRAAAPYRWAHISILLVCGLVYFALLLIAKIPFAVEQLLVPLALGGLVVLEATRTKKEQQYRAADIDVMKAEVLNRLEAVKRWND